MDSSRILTSLIPNTQSVRPPPCEKKQTVSSERRIAGLEAMRAGAPTSPMFKTVEISKVEAEDD